MALFVRAILYARAAIALRPRSVSRSGTNAAISARYDPRFEGLRDDSRFQALLGPPSPTNAPAGHPPPVNQPAANPPGAVLPPGAKAPQHRQPIQVPVSGANIQEAFANAPAALDIEAANIRTATATRLKATRLTDEPIREAEAIYTKLNG